jgi:hypothetical protein
MANTTGALRHLHEWSTNLQNGQYQVFDIILSCCLASHLKSATKCNYGADFWIGQKDWYPRTLPHADCSRITHCSELEEYGGTTCLYVQAD